LGEKITKQLSDFWHFHTKPGQGGFAVYAQTPNSFALVCGKMPGGFPTKHGQNQRYAKKNS
jgi:hypothetical protein